jgi:hypothetical protein
MTPTERPLTRERDEPGPTVGDCREYAFTLFVSGASDLSANAIEDARQICDAHLPGRQYFSIVCLHQQPVLAEHHHVLATPDAHTAPRIAGASGHRADVSSRKGAS